MSATETGLSKVGEREFLRHTLATLAYRAAKTLHDVPQSFASFRPSETTRTPAEILAHAGDLMDWALSLAQGAQVWRDSVPLAWDLEAERFFVTMRAFDDYLASSHVLGCSVEGLFQGPVADALTHIGQIAMLRRMAGSPIRGENYFMANILAGHVGPEQAAPKREFD